MTNWDERFDRIDANLDRIGSELDAADVRLDGTPAKFDLLEACLVDFRREANGRFTSVEHKLDLLVAATASCDAHLAELEQACLEFCRISEQITERFAGAA